MEEQLARWRDRVRDSSGNSHKKLPKRTVIATTKPKRQFFMAIGTNSPTPPALQRPLIYLKDKRAGGDTPKIIDIG